MAQRTQSPSVPPRSLSPDASLCSVVSFEFELYVFSQLAVSAILRFYQT